MDHFDRANLLTSSPAGDALAERFFPYATRNTAEDKRAAIRRLIAAAEHLRIPIGIVNDHETLEAEFACATYLERVLSFLGKDDCAPEMLPTPVETGGDHDHY